MAVRTKITDNRWTFVRLWVRVEDCISDSVGIDFGAYSRLRRQGKSRRQSGSRPGQRGEACKTFQEPRSQPPRRQARLRQPPRTPPSSSSISTTARVTPPRLVSRSLVLIKSSSSLFLHRWCRDFACYALFSPFELPHWSTRPTLRVSSTLSMHLAMTSSIGHHSLSVHAFPIEPCLLLSPRLQLKSISQSGDLSEICTPYRSAARTHLSYFIIPATLILYCLPVISTLPDAPSHLGTNSTTVALPCRWPKVKYIVQAVSANDTLSLLENSIPEALSALCFSRQASNARPSLPPPRLAA
jgi:hypothetical protein